MTQQQEKAKEVIANRLPEIAERIYRAVDLLKNGTEDEISTAIGFIARAEAVCFDAREHLCAIVDGDLQEDAADALDGDIK